MGTEPSSNEIKSKEILQTEINNTTYDKEYNFIDINSKYDIKVINKNSKNDQKKLLFEKKNKGPKSLTNIFLMNYKANKANKANKNIEKKRKNKNIYNTKEKQVILKNNLTPINNNKPNNNIYFDYFKCILCPMCILIEINPRNNHVLIKCENGHNNEMNIDSFISIYQIFKYSCDKCKKELSSKYYYCNKCKGLFCETCKIKNLDKEINKGHAFLNESEINFFCDKHKKRFISFCKNCQKNCCKKCCVEHNSHELLLIKNEIRDNNYIMNIEKMIKKEKEIIDKIEEKYPTNIFKNKDEKLLKAFNRLISLRKKENQLKNKILNIYQDCVKKINNNINENEKTEENLDISISSISSTTNTAEYPNNFLMNFYFLKSLNQIENEVLTNETDFFDISEDNKYFNDFSELKNFLLNYKKNIISPEKNLENFSKLYTIYKKPNFIFPLEDGNFIVTYDTKIIFYDVFSGNELLILDEEIFDYTYKIIKLPDNTLLFFGDFLNQIKIDENGSIKVLFTGSHVEISKEIILDENNLVFIDKITQKLKLLTNRDINWHKEIFCENLEKKDMNKECNNCDLNNSMMLDAKKTIQTNDNENKLNNSFMTMNDCNEAKELFLNSIKNIRQNKEKKVNEKIKNTNNINYQIKTYDIISIDETNFISLQEKGLLNKETCLRKFNYDKNNDKFNLIEMISLQEEPLKKNDVLYIIKNEKEKEKKFGYLSYGTSDKKYFVIFDLDKRIIVSKINMNFISYKFIGNILFFQHQNELNQYVYSNNDFIYIFKIPFNNIIHSIQFLKDFSLIIDDKKFTYLYTHKKIISENNENI